MGSNGSLDVGVSQNPCLLATIADAPSSGDDEDGEDVAEDTGELRTYAQRAGQGWAGLPPSHSLVAGG